MKTTIFKKAWTIAKLAAIHLGGKAIEYFAEALKMAHKIVRTHCRITKHDFSFGVLNGYIKITTPKGLIIKISSYIARTRTQYSKFILDLAKQSFVLLTDNEIELLSKLSIVKF